MGKKVIRHSVFYLHRWLGLGVGLLLCIAGLTGSVLVFWHEIDAWILAQRFGSVDLAGERIPIATVIETVNAAYIPDEFTLSSLTLPTLSHQPYVVWLEDAAAHHWQVLVNPYMGQVMGDRQWETSWIGRIYALHYSLLAGEVGSLIMGMVALFAFILSLTGIILWPGWRKLIAGFKIKWRAHPKRINFDLHKVIGIIAALFLAAIGFTGFSWNVPQARVTDAIHAVTLTPKPADLSSRSIPGQSPLPLGNLVQRAEAAMPEAAMTYVVFPSEPEDPFRVGKKQAQEKDRYGQTQVYLDQFSGEVLQINDGLNPSRADAILNQFGPLHYGTFGGLPTRILYVFVGLSPTALFITGLVMWRYRKT
ncbi:PepSY-associated TM helix domain-containing protein [Thermocoleostomius sinensis]|uniref:PepSY-associated TM helix domain-containing protein n=1 Tax=Thermocoleostomius sinensis A174 TaxID=2016057 RepID=A0A9E8ZKV5_9CYAN|nr:PepSY-associated TM helix domain-containing protein [Thermocoleostomius sinensis]WAL60356.1 PepSY-associated TM helix domain-containing protein [Thermocoleostomius sinensis A174]